MNIADTMIELCEMSGPAGFETPVAERIADILRPYVDEVRIDPLGSVIGVRRCGQPNAKKLLFDAHIDEIGFIVTGYADGFLKFSTLGGMDARLLPASEIMLLTEEPIWGVVAAMPPHLLSADEMDKAIDLDKLYLDVGMTDEEVKKAIPLGTPGVFTSGVRHFGEKMICGKSLDDRACFVSILRALDLLKEETLNCDFYILASTQEEVGMRGATVASFGIAPDYAIAIDVGHAQTPDAKDIDIKLGAGVGIDIGPNMNPRMVKRLKSIAEEKGIAHQFVVVPGGMSGTNTSAIQMSQSGVVTALLDLPLKYMHTPYEVIDLDDAEGLAVLLAEFAKAFEKEGL